MSTLTDEQIAEQMRVIEDAPDGMHSAAFVYDLLCYLQAARIEIADLKVVSTDEELAVIEAWATGAVFTAFFEVADINEAKEARADLKRVFAELKAARTTIADLTLHLADAHAEIEAQQAQWDAAQATRIELGGVWVYPPRNHH